MIQKLFRSVATLCGMLFGYGIASFLVSDDVFGEAWEISPGEEIIAQLTFAFFFGLLFNSVYNAFRSRGERFYKNVEGALQKVPAGDMISSVIGLICGMIIAFLISQIINEISILQAAYLNVIISVALYIFFGVIGVNVGRRVTKEVTLPLTNLTTIAKDSTAKRKAAGAAPKILDTSVIIDGRIADIMKTGFIEGTIIIPDFVLVELRHIADSSDGLKRARGRRGLDILNRIQSDYGIEIFDTTAEKTLEEIPEVDVKLLKLAQIMKGMVVTNDFNLNKVAAITGIGVLNINELANTLKPVVIPGEQMQAFLVKEGKENNQAVAYLDDGTMIVVEDGRKFIGQTITLIVTSVLQTSAGRMIFAKPMQA